ncbi:hypothetical protein AVEN_39763-1 [Araneus ventricosus]|uniref:Uncharacterized protein n=1 Tax=Araneus ventricosus TaxID=182803 RepID=A0A4Y2I548_ARAVE|nr:hypothetical protein AVEN_39763-1 [Araneus ventricosus]
MCFCFGTSTNGAPLEVVRFGQFSLVILSLSPVLKQHEDYFGKDLVILNLGQMTRTTQELAPPLQTSTPHQREGVWLSTYDLPCNKPNTRRISSGIGFRIWNPSALKSRPYH